MTSIPLVIIDRTCEINTVITCLSSQFKSSLPNLNFRHRNKSKKKFLLQDIFLLPLIFYSVGRKKFCFVVKQHERCLFI